MLYNRKGIWYLMRRLHLMKRWRYRKTVCDKEESAKTAEFKKGFEFDEGGDDESDDQQVKGNERMGRFIDCW